MKSLIILKLYVIQLSIAFYTNHFKELRKFVPSFNHIQTSSDLDRIYRIKSHEISDINHPVSKGFGGFIFSLEGSLVDVSKLIGYSYSILAGDLHQNAPNPVLLNDLIDSRIY
jgi:hypothetical protein